MAEEKQAIPKVYAAMAAVIGDLAEIGISKNKKNTEFNYSYRGIDDVYNALAPCLAKRGLLIVPTMLKREVMERKTRNGAPIFYVLLHLQIDFISAEDGSRHSVEVFGEGTDMQDKGTNKALSNGYKYAVITALCIPVEGMHESDADPVIETLPIDDSPVGAKGVNVPKEQGSKAASKSTKKGAASETPAKQPNLTPDELASLSLAIDEATDDVSAKAICMQLYRSRERIGDKRLNELATAAISKRGQFVGPEMYDNFETNISEFEKVGMIGKKDFAVIVSATRSRLNMPQLNLEE